MIKRLIEKVLNRETVAYLICGFLTTAVSLAVYRVCMFVMPVAASNTVSVAAGIVFAYIVNKIFVFRSRSWALKTLRAEIAPFMTGRVALYVAETAALVLLVDVATLPEFICKCATTAVVIVANYLISKKLVFKMP
jgi:putative flippase GtrA